MTDPEGMVLVPIWTLKLRLWAGQSSQSGQLPSICGAAPVDASRGDTATEIWRTSGLPGRVPSGRAVQTTSWLKVVGIGVHRLLGESATVLRPRGLADRLGKRDDRVAAVDLLGNREPHARREAQDAHSDSHGRRPVRG